MKADTKPDLHDCFFFMQTRTEVNDQCLFNTGLDNSYCSVMCKYIRSTVLIISTYHLFYVPKNSKCDHESFCITMFADVYRHGDK